MTSRARLYFLAIVGGVFRTYFLVCFCFFQPSAFGNSEEKKGGESSEIQLAENAKKTQAKSAEEVDAFQKRLNAINKQLLGEVEIEKTNVVKSRVEHLLKSSDNEIVGEHFVAYGIGIGSDPDRNLAIAKINAQQLVLLAGGAYIRVVNENIKLTASRKVSVNSVVELLNRSNRAFVEVTSFIKRDASETVGEFDQVLKMSGTNSLPLIVKSIVEKVGQCLKLADRNEGLSNGGKIGNVEGLSEDESGFAKGRQSSLSGLRGLVVLRKLTLIETNDIPSCRFECDLNLVSNSK